MRRLGRWVLISAASLSMALPIPASAGAPSSAAVAGGSAAMQVVGIDAAQASRVGNKVEGRDGYRILIDGKTNQELMRVPLSGQTASFLTNAVHPDNLITGTCGNSYFYIYDDPGTKFHIRTGFDLNSNAIDFKWRTQTIGSNSTQTDNWEWGDDGPMVPDDVWTSGNKYSTQDARSGTQYNGRVTTGLAFLVNGGVCGSAYPSAAKKLYTS